jgi:hypothetical protein
MSMRSTIREIREPNGRKSAHFSRSPYVAHGTGSQCDLCDLERSPHFLFHWSMVTSDVHIDHAKFEDHTFIGNKEK